jgi:TolA-binding protein
MRFWRTRRWKRISSVHETGPAGHHCHRFRSPVTVLCLTALILFFPLAGTPGHSSARDDLILLAEKAYQDGLYQLARKQWIQFIDQSAGDQRRYRAVMMVGETFFMEKDYRQAADWYGKWAGEYHPDDLAMREHFLYREGEALFHQGRYRESMEVISGLAREYPGGRFSERASFLAGEGAFRMGAYSESLGFFIPLASSGGELARISLYRQAQSRYLLAEYDGAVPLFQQFFDRHPQDSLAPMARFYLADSLFLKGDYLASAYSFAEFSRNHAGHAMAQRAVFREGEAFYREGRYREAVAAADRLTGVYPSGSLVPEALFLKAMSLVELGRLGEAVEALGSITTADQELEGDLLERSLRWQGIISFELEDYDGAAASLGRLLREFPEGSDGEVLLKAGLSSMQLGRNTEAEIYLDELVGSSADKELLSSGYYGLGELAYRRGEYETAVRNYEKVDPEMLKPEARGNFLWNSGSSYLNLERTDRAIESIGELTESPPGGDLASRAAFELAVILLEKDRPEDSLTWFEKALSLSPGDHLAGEAEYGRARALLKTGRDGEARAVLKELSGTRKGDVGERAALELAALARAGGDWQGVIDALSVWTDWEEGLRKTEAAYHSAGAACRLEDWDACLQAAGETISSVEDGDELADRALLLKAYSLEGLEREVEAAEIYDRLLGGEAAVEIREMARERLMDLKPPSAE